MDVGITARHSEIPASIADRARERVSALERFEPQATAADVIFDLDHGVSRAEIKLLSAGRTSVAHGSGATFRTALDEAVERLSRQLRKRHDQRARRKRTAANVKAD